MVYVGVVVWFVKRKSSFVLVLWRMERGGGADVLYMPVSNTFQSIKKKSIFFFPFF